VAGGVRGDALQSMDVLPISARDPYPSYPCAGQAAFDAGTLISAGG
jgi:hypothetical protein